jgi:hypothetical protein
MTSLICYTMHQTQRMMVQTEDVDEHEHGSNIIVR